MRRSCLGILAVAVLAGAAGARDYTQDWKFGMILQPQEQFVHGKKPGFRWRRVRGLAGGPITAELKARLQLDWSNEAVRLLDGYLDYTPIKKPVRLEFRGGMQYPDWPHDAVTFPDTINYSYIVTNTRMALRNAGFQAMLGFLGSYQVSAGVFNGEQNFNDRHGTPNYVFAFTAVQPKFDAKAWMMLGKDAKLTTGEARTDLYGAEITNVHLGRLNAEASGLYGRRLGRRMIGGYLQAGYWFTGCDVVYERFDYCDLSRTTPGNVQQRYIVSYHHRFRPWLDTLWDVEFDQKTERPSFWARGDIRF
ncbi:MAG: hypothetical protein HYU66_07000 [Armatimonadetes bacterium]|nr:hypothetical protein [Armatimonadota bacterium]